MKSIFPLKEIFFFLLCEIILISILTKIYMLDYGNNHNHDCFTEAKKRYLVAKKCFSCLIHSNTKKTTRKKRYYRYLILKQPRNNIRSSITSLCEMTNRVFIPSRRHFISCERNTRRIKAFEIRQHPEQQGLT